MNFPKYLRMVGICVILNLLSEFWVHGWAGFLNPVLTGSLIVLYTTYFLMLEDLIVRYRLKDYQVMILAFIFGLWHETFTTGSVFGDAIILGLNPIIIIIATFFWWGAMQSVAFLYYANRLVGERDWDHRRMGRLGWILCLFFSLQAAQNYMKTLGSSVESYIIIFGLLALAGILFVKSVKDREIPLFERSRTLDILMLVHLIACILIGFTIGSMSNPVSLIGFVVWSVVFGLIIGLVRFRWKRPIPV